MASRPRAVILHRQSLYESLLARHATHGQVVFFLQQRGLSVEPVYQAHLLQETCIREINNLLPSTWRYAGVERGQLDRFDFSPEDVVLVIGQDGLVPNVSKYLTGQQVIGFDPLCRTRHDSTQVMVNHHYAQLTELLARFESGSLQSEHRTMLKARLDDAQMLVALNELFIGHISHQSAKYDIHYHKQREYQSSSGIIVATGTGSTGWMSSLNAQSKNPLTLPAPEERALTFRVREPWVSRQTSAGITAGLIQEDESLSILSKMETQGVIFGDGIEQDFLTFDWGQRVIIEPDENTLNICTNRM